MTSPQLTSPLKPLAFIRRSHRVWEARVFAEYSLTIMYQPRGWLFRQRHYPSLPAAKAAAQALLLAELTPLLAVTQPPLQQAA